MLSWSTIFGGGVMSAIAAGLLVAVVRPRRGLVIAVASVAAFLGPVSWNAILHRVEGRQFFLDAPVAAFPISWQDTGSGVFTWRWRMCCSGWAQWPMTTGAGSPLPRCSLVWPRLSWTSICTDVDLPPMAVCRCGLNVRSCRCPAALTYTRRDAPGDLQRPGGIVTVSLVEGLPGVPAWSRVDLGTPLPGRIGVSAARLNNVSQVGGK